MRFLSKFIILKLIIEFNCSYKNAFHNDDYINDSVFFHVNQNMALSYLPI
jgi:hypothetical protein